MSRAKKLKTVVKKGSRLDSLIALRDRIADDLDNCESKRDTVSLTKQLREIMKEIEDIEGKTEKADTPVTKTALEIVRGKFKKEA